ncbi:synemin [Carlito syrichta]|uniref:Synemin n=1 Tax=Carlito syrichta TaxID=1868482 RepID=A0A3Q0E0G1_CARSF|nr:synemin [Carlito syrichta]
MPSESSLNSSKKRVIDCLENEKATLTLAMTDRLRDYQELLQAKTGLSLEVATYRALLEGESNPEIVIWTKDVEIMPPDFRNKSCQYTDSVLQRENERNLFPRQKAPLASLNHSSALYSNLSGHLGSRTTPSIGSAARRGFLGSGYCSLATAQQESSYGKTVNSQTNSRTFSPTYGLLRNTEAQVKTFPDRPEAEGTRDVPIYLTKDSTVSQESHRERRDHVVVGASESTWSNERTDIWEKKTEAKATREQERIRPGTAKIKQEEKMFDSKEKASEERNLRWEELTKLDKEARERESQQMRERARGKESSEEKLVREREVPIHVEVSQDRRPEVSLKGLQMPGKDTGDGTGREADTREARFRLGTGDTASSLLGDSMTENIAENIVTSILKQFTQSPETEASTNSFPDTKVTYVDRKELPGERKTKTEIVVESKLTEDIDVSDEAGLDYLLSKDIKEVGLKGKSAERMIGDIINLGLKGREGRAKVVNVEIVEEPVNYVGGERADEFSVPFEVEEVDDVSPGPRGLVEEEESYDEADVTFSVSQQQRTKQPQEIITHVEEVTEAGDSEGEQSYFVSTPDEYPGGHDRDDGSVYGQIHIEEESTLRYSWQDEIVQGTWRRRKRDGAGGEEAVKPLNIPAASLEEDLSSTHWKEQARSGEFHAEPTVIEKEIKIPHEFHTSIKGISSKEPRRQLVEVIGQLEETLPERMKEELSALTREGQGQPGSISVDVKKVQASGGGSVTLVAEVNLSQTVDADQFDLEGLSRDEASKMEKAVESVVQESLTKRHSSAPGSPNGEDGVEAPATGIRFKRWATRELYSSSGEREDAGQASHSSARLTSQGPVSATVEVSSPRGFAQSQVLEDMSQSVRHIKLGPSEVWRTERVSYEGPAAGVVEVSRGGDLGRAAGTGASRSVRYLTLGPGQSQVSREVFFRGSDPACQEAGGPEEPGPAEFSIDTNRLGRRSTFGSKQFHAEKEIIFQGSISAAGKVGDYFVTEESAGTHTSVRYLQLGHKEGLSEQVHLTAPLSDEVELGDRGGSVHTEELPVHSMNSRHTNDGPQGHQITQHIVCQGLVSPPMEFSDPESTVHKEGSADVTKATHTLGRETFMTEKSIFQRVISKSPREDNVGDTSGTSGISRSFRHIQLDPKETETFEQVFIHGPVSKTLAPANSADSPELGELTDGSRMLQHVTLGPKETSFTFQMDVSNVEAIRSWTQEAEAHSGAWRDAASRNEQAAGVSVKAFAGEGPQAHGEQGKEQAEFDKTVQLQRMVDQRSVISDEKKVALLYLDNEEEENDGHWF